MSEKSFGWCFLGTGTLAQKVAKEITASGRHRIVSSFSRTIEKNIAFSQKNGASACKTAEEAILSEGVDGVYVVTPHPSHYPLAKKALLLGKPVLCEKPFTMTEKQAADLFQIARERNLYVAEAMWTWFAPVANRMKEWVDRGKFGTISYVLANYHMNGKGYAPRVTDPAQGGGALLDIGVYPIHYLIRLFGLPLQVHCSGRISGGIDLGEEIDLTFQNGMTCRASASIDDWKGLERFIIRGSTAKSSVFLFHMANSAKLKKGWKTLETVKGYGGMLNEFDLTAKEIREGRTTSRFVPPEATLQTMHVLDECRRQMGLIYSFEGDAEM